MARKSRSKLTFANVASALALFFALSTGAAYANHLRVFSSDIVDGQVKRHDIAAGAVTRPKLAGNAVTGAKVLDDSLRGVDIDESTLAGVHAATLDGYSANALVKVGGAATSTDVGLPDCDPGIDYMVLDFTAPTAGFAVVNAAFTAGVPDGDGDAVAARLERTSPSVISSGWQEEIMNTPGRVSIAMTQLFPVAQGANSFVIHACDSQDFAAAGSGIGLEGHMTLVFTPFA